MALRPPRLPVLSNVTAQPFPGEPEAIAALLGRQLVEPVQWEASLRALLDPAAAPLLAEGAEGGGAGAAGAGGDVQVRRPRRWETCASCDAR